LEQGQVLVKTWSVQNNGVEVWPTESKLIFLRGDRELLGETEEFSVLSAKPGQTVEISVPITTPTKPGSYSAYFQLADANRSVFGPRLWLEVVVTRDDEDDRKHAPPTSISIGTVSSIATSAATASSSSSSSTISASAASASSSTSAPIVDTSGWIDVKVETSPVTTPATRSPVVTAAVPMVAITSVPVTTLAASPSAIPTPVVTVSAPKPVVAAVTVVSTPPKPAAVVVTPPSKYAAQLASLSSMGFNNSELNSFLLEKHNGDIQHVSNWLLENMNH
jgi:next-to-BRCA1 protein 1